MLLIRTRLAPSAIHGLGVFACDPVPAGAVVWQYDPRFDRTVTAEEFAAAPAAFRAFLEAYAYPSADLEGAMVLSCDNAKFLNHSDDPNTEESPFVSVACRMIGPGEEITCNYGAFCVGWSGFGP